MKCASPSDLQRLMGSDFAPTEQQWAAITEGLEPVVVIAGAGSGKTTLMAARVVYLVATGTARPDQILGLTFTNKAAAELRERVHTVLEGSGLLPRPGKEQASSGTEESEAVVGPAVSTYNAYAAGLLRDHATRIGREPDLRLISPAAASQLAAEVVGRHRGSIEHLTGGRSAVAAQVLGLDRQMDEHLVSPDQVRAGQERFLEGWLAERPGRRTASNVLDVAISAAQVREELLDLVAEYRQAKTRLGVIEFSDQIALASRIAEECPDVAAAERERFPVVLLDEYQDTSVAQAALLGRLFSPSGGGHGVMAVGDPNQAIYGWRGASVANITHFSDTFPRSDGSDPEPLPLSVSMRSGRDILDLANSLAAPLYEETRGTEPLTPRPGADQGRVEVALYESDTDEIAALPALVRAARAEEGSWREVGVLARDNKIAALVFDALVAEGIPVEIVGLKGLLGRPEIAAVVDVLRILEDPTANDAALNLLGGPRWRIGPRDLRILARRAGHLAGGGPDRAAEPPVGSASLEQHLDELTGAADPAELTALLDAVDDPGELDYSPEALARLRAFAAELGELRRHVGDPIADLVRRVISVTGIEIELAAAGSTKHLDNLDAFVGVAGEFRAVDGVSDLSALLAYLDAESSSGQGLDQQTARAREAVQLLTVHRAKGLEFGAVFVVGLTESVFPDATSPSRWTRKASELPAPVRGDASWVPSLGGYDKAAMERYDLDLRAHQATEELRLGYVAFTRAKRLLVLSGCWWRKENKKPSGPSEFLTVARDHVVAQGREPLIWWPEPEDGAVNPRADAGETVHWPSEEDAEEAARRREGAALVRAALLAEGSTGASGGHAGEVDADPRIAVWDAELERLVAEQERLATADVEVPWPGSLSATGVMVFRRDPEEFLLSVVRPMPRQPSRAARLGTRFHAWIERQLAPGASQALVELDLVPGREDADIRDEAELGELAAAFLASPFGQRADGHLEIPFALSLGGQVVRGRIDAVFPDSDSTDGSSDGDGWLVVDWKTNRSHDADPIQLAVYREAWADLQGIPADRVRVAFYYIRDGALVEPEDLPDRAGLEELLSGGDR